VRHWPGANRDEAVREAFAAGLSIGRIQHLSGLATTTIMRILNKRPAGAEAASPPPAVPGVGHRREPGPGG
jgi:hypothetical protein